jgi:hypothetical protein
MSDDQSNNASSKFAPVSRANRTSISTDVKKIAEAATGKVMIGSLDDPRLVVEAQYNPKELEVVQTVPWQKTNEANRSNRRGAATSRGEDQGIHLEFTGADGRSVTLELLFDGYEPKRTQGSEPDPRSVDVEACVKKLADMASVRTPGSTREDEKRPHRCVVSWGKVLPAFKCVIESLSTKYTMFDANGKPLRATCTVKLKEADFVSSKKK